MPRSTAPRERSDFSRRAARLLFLNSVQFHARFQDKSFTAAKPRRGRQAVEPAMPALLSFRSGLPAPALIGLQLAHGFVHACLKFFAFLLFAFEGVGEPSLHDNTRNLCGDGGQQANFVTRKFAPPRGLNHQDAERHLARDQWHPQKRVKMLLVRFRKVLVAGMGQRIDHHYRLHPFDHQAGQSFAGCHGDFANGIRVETHGGPKRQAIFFLIENVQ